MYKRVKLLPLLTALLLLGAIFASPFLSGSASAAPLLSRSLTLEAGTGAASAPGDGVHTAKHLFTFTLSTGTNLGSIQFLYCSTPDPLTTCHTPVGLVTTSATLTSQTGANTGFTLNNTTNGSPYLTRTAASGVTASSSSYELSGIINPDDTNCYVATPAADNCTFYVRISTFASTDTTGGTTDSGTVAASTATPIVLSGYMPESLVFCTGATVGTTSGVPDCSTATSGAISFNQDFSPTDTSTATSQMAASTNATSGYAISVNGSTLTSGGNQVNPIQTAATGSIHGVSQFGMNLKANTTASSTPAVGTEVAPASNGTNYRAQAETNYNTIDNFYYQTTNTVADSYSGGAGGTDAQIFTASYIVNVPGSQPAGTYTTTLTYICTPTF